MIHIAQFLLASARHSHGSADGVHSLLCSATHKCTNSRKEATCTNYIGFSLALQKCFKKSNCTETARQETGKDEGEGKGGLVESLLVSKPIFVYLVALFLFLKLYYCSAVIFKELWCRCFSAFLVFFFLIL